MGKGSVTSSRVGVFLCECGDEISSVVDLSKVRESVAGLDAVALVSRTRYWCSPSGRRRLAAEIEKSNLDAVVVAGCSPRTHGFHMAEAAARAGVNRNRTVMVNLKEHCAIVHPRSPTKATAKAERLIRVGVERARRARPLDPIVTDVERRAVIIGGGVSGMTSAHALAVRGLEVVLIEKNQKLGGLLNSVNLLYPGYCDATRYAEELTKTLHEDSGVQIMTESKVTDVSGHTGAYRLAVETKGKATELSAGCVIVATGADVLAPEGLFGYGGNPKVVTQFEFEAMLRKGLEGVKRVVMIQCAGSRNAERPYCSRVCCTATVKNTVSVMESVPDAQITVLSRGFAEYVGDLDRARDAGVMFLRYDVERPPSVGPTSVDVFDMISSTEKSIPYDLVVLATPLVARAGTAEVARLLNLPTDDYGFVAEPHTKLRPAAYAPGGVFIAGSAHWPATVTECLSQAHGAAARAAALLKRGTIEREPLVAVVDELTCRGCERCAEACAHGAPILTGGEDNMKRSSIDTIRCVGCGVCVSVCPSSAITLSQLTSAQLLAMAGAAAAP